MMRPPSLRTSSTIPRYPNYKHFRVVLGRFDGPEAVVARRACEPQAVVVVVRSFKAGWNHPAILDLEPQQAAESPAGP